MRIFRLMVNAAAAVALQVLVAHPAVAHHGWSEYDSNVPLTLTGTVELAGYEHPHGHIRLKTADKVWIAVLAPPSRMENRGLAKDQLVAGAVVTVEGYPNKFKPDEMRAERIRIGGKTIELR